MPVPLIDTVPVPAIVKPPKPASKIVPPLLVEVTVPLSVSVKPFTFIVMLWFDEIVTFELTVVLALLVVMNAPPLKLKVVEPLAAENVSVWPVDGHILIAPPPEDIVALPPLCPLIVIAADTPPSSIVTVDDPRPV